MRQGSAAVASGAGRSAAGRPEICTGDPDVPLRLRRRRGALHLLGRRRLAHRFCEGADPGRSCFPRSWKGRQCSGSSTSTGAPSRSARRRQETSGSTGTSAIFFLARPSRLARIRRVQEDRGDERHRGAAILPETRLYPAGALHEKGSLMRAATREYLKQQFSAYYADAHLPVPPSLSEREWGFIFFDATYPEIRMRRHVAFGSRIGLVEYIRSLIPAHVYYSSAYYRTPEASTMQEKGWAGADLIFDLDADHIVRGPYEMMLARVREETEKLLAMLTGELGFDQKLIEVVFSGRKGIPCACARYRGEELGECGTAGADRLRLRDRDRARGDPPDPVTFTPRVAAPLYSGAARVPHMARGTPSGGGKSRTGDTSRRGGGIGGSFSPEAAGPDGESLERPGAGAPG